MTNWKLNKRIEGADDSYAIEMLGLPKGTRNEKVLGGAVELRRGFNRNGIFRTSK